jgi:hypothetical protein
MPGQQSHVKKKATTTSLHLVCNALMPSDTQYPVDLNLLRNKKLKGLELEI